jgi:glycosyltransferase involved in cell wall biosynthesis
MNSIPAKDKDAGVATADIRELIQTLQSLQETQAKSIRVIERLTAALTNLAGQGGTARLLSNEIALVVGDAGRGERPPGRLELGAEPQRSDRPAPVLLQPLTSLFQEGGANALRLPPRRFSRTLSVSWVIGPKENAGWAYGNNARRLSQQLPEFDHVIGTEDADVAVYFDVIVAERYPVKARHSVVRVGGPRPLDRLYGSDPARTRDGLAKFDAVIALNLELYRRLAPLHPRVVLIPNALDLREWHTEGRRKSLPPEFTVGFAASATSPAEIKVKGVAVAEGAVQETGARLHRLQRGDGTQISHDRMREDFYSRIHALVHPVQPGREGSSNVIMEALACGVPVITTLGAGLHSELLVDRKSVLIRDANVEAFAEAIELLRSDRKLRDNIAATGRDFAERNHNLPTAARAYARLIASIREASRVPPTPSVSFVPFWMPPESFASSRLRAQYPVEILQEHGWSNIAIGPADRADIAVIAQSADNPVMEKLKANKEQFVVYDVCDRYFENPRQFKRPDGEVNSQTRFEELIERADLVTVPTSEMKVEIAQRYPHKPVVHMPEPIDYNARRHPLVPLKARTVLWFGNPDRGNFESSRWLIEHLRDRHGYTPLIVSRPGFFRKNHPELVPHVVEWSHEAMQNAFAKADLAVVTHSAEEQTKSPNRLVTTVIHGLPVLVSGSASCGEIMNAAGMGFAVVSTTDQLDRAMIKIEDPLRRKPFVEKLQRHLLENFGRPAIAVAYRDLFENRTFRHMPSRKLRVGFVSHNLVLGEGAPRSLFELAQGLQAAGYAESFAYSPGAGPLASAYVEAGVPLEIFDRSVGHVSKALNRRYAPLHKHFLEWLKIQRIDVLVCNTAKAGAFAHIADEAGIPSIVIVRESFEPERRYSDFEHEARLATELGVSQAQNVVFVAKTSREAWSDHKFFGSISVIPNGVDPSRFGSSLIDGKAEMRASLGLPQDKVIALCVGTVNLRKGQDGIVKAFTALPAAVRDKAHIVFLGALENSYLPQFEAMLAELPPEIRDRLTLVRATNEVGPWYRASDFLLMNSTSEAYPRAVVEGLLFGLPVLSTAVFGVKEQVTSGENGFLYEFDAMEDWKRHFTTLVEDGERRATMSATAARSFWKLTTHAEMLHAYRTLLMKLAATKTLPNQAA